MKRLNNLQVSEVIDWQDADILKLAKSLASGHQNIEAIAFLICPIDLWDFS